MTFRSEAWRKCVAALGYCVQCGRKGVQTSHRDEGKGMGLKTSDALTAALCPECHRDNGSSGRMTRDERRAAMDRAIIRTLERLADEGLVIPDGKEAAKRLAANE